MQKKMKKILLLSFLFMFLFSASYIAKADVGSFDRYDSGGSSWSSSSSWDSSSDWGSSSSSYSGSYSGGGGIEGLVILAILFIIIAVAKKKGFHPRNNINKNRVVNRTPEMLHNSANVVKQIKAVDPEFNEEEFLRFAKNLYVRLQNAWTKRDWEPMRPYESVELFEQHRMQLQEYIDTNRINVVDRIAVNAATLYQFKQEGGKDTLSIYLKATKKDYIIDATTKEVLEGNKYADRVTVYQMVFERKTGILSKAATEEVETTNCPNCGAPTNITSSGRCEYCGSLITTDNHDWVLTRLEPASNAY